MESERIVHEFEKGGGEVIRCRVTTFKGQHYADVRVFWEDDDGEHRPSKKGITVAVDLIDELAEGIAKLKAAVQ